MSRTNPTIVAPQFTHDCETCHFLGRYVSLDSQRFDLYLCPNREGDMVGRFGDEPSEYASLPLDMGPHVTHGFYGELLKRAFDACLIT